MRAMRLLGPALFVAGVAAIAIALARGEATLSLVLIFPVLTADGAWAVLGIALVVAAFFATFLTWTAPVEAAPEPIPPPPTMPAQPQPSPQRRWGGVVFLGPIPIVFGSDARVTRWMLFLGVLLFVALLLLTLYLGWAI